MTDKISPKNKRLPEVGVIEGFPSLIVPEQETMNLETALVHLTASYRKGMDSVKNEKDWIPADEVDCIL